jgi:hypothetical protein
MIKQGTCFDLQSLHQSHSINEKARIKLETFPFFPSLHDTIRLLKYILTCLHNTIMEKVALLSICSHRVSQYC